MVLGGTGMELVFEVGDCASHGLELISHEPDDVDKLFDRDFYPAALLFGLFSDLSYHVNSGRKGVDDMVRFLSR